MILLPDEGRRPLDDSHYQLSDPYYICTEAPGCDCPYATGNLMWKVETVSAGGVFDGRVSGQTPLAAEGDESVRRSRFVACPQNFPVMDPVQDEDGDDLDLPLGEDEGNDDDEGDAADDADEVVEGWEISSSNCLACQSLRRDALEQDLARWRAEYDRNLVRPLDLKGPASAYAVITPDGLWHECVQPEDHDLIVGETRHGGWLDAIRDDRELTKQQVAWRFRVAELLMSYQHCWLLGTEASLAPCPPRICADGAFEKRGETWLPRSS